MTGQDKTTNYFIDTEDDSKIQKSLSELLSTLQKRTMAMYIPLENAQRLKHGGAFQNPAAPQVLNGGLEAHSSQINLPYESVAQHDISAMERCFKDFQDQMGTQFAQMFYRSISNACDHSGNVVDASKSGSLQQAFIEMLETVEFGVDKSGNVALPEIHVGKEGFDKLNKMMIEATPEDRKIIEEIKERKSKEALERELQRKAKFVHYGEEE
ncbi:hypothetical protein [Pseudomonas sp. NPDC096925]|uniref:hypothetical protein n=1 Tax=Pseudomonas sp. NPDC096925 TaxID=3364484 RepID=UPI00383A5523